MVVAGAPPPTRTIERVETELGWEFVQIYGLTETAPLLTMNRRRAEFDDLDPGPNGPNVSAGPARPRSAWRWHVDAEGEVLARCNVVMAGYWQQPEETAEAIVDGWFRTGDGGYIDDDNYVTISDRKKDVIISGGENVSSIEVEDCPVPASRRGRGGGHRRARTRSGARRSTRSSCCATGRRSPRTS